MLVHGFCFFKLVFIGPKELTNLRSCVYFIGNLKETAETLYFHEPWKYDLQFHVSQRKPPQEIQYQVYT